MQVYELLLLPIYFALILVAGLVMREIRYKFSTCKRFLVPALIFKLLGAMAFAGVYKFYYGGGDTTEYFRGGLIVSNVLMENPTLVGQLFFTQAGEASYTNKIVAEQIGGYYNNQTTLIVIRFAAIFNVFAFDSFWLTTLLFASFAFLGMWAMYRVFISIYPTLETEMAVSVLFMPSVLFWGSGIMKDTLAITALGWLIYSIYTLFTRPNTLVSILFRCIGAVVCLFIIATVKAYIIAALLPATLYFIPKRLFAFFKSGASRLTVKIFFWATIALTIYTSKEYIILALQKAIFQFLKMAMGFQGWHGFLAKTIKNSSGYSLGEVEFTPIGIAKKIIPSIIVALFRPYLYEVRNPVMLLTALESTLLLLLTGYVLYKTRFTATRKIIANNSIIAFFLIFSLIFAFAVGFTSYNFGALARYKIPCLPFYTSALFMLLYEYKKRQRLSPSTITQP